MRDVIGIVIVLADSFKRNIVLLAAQCWILHYHEKKQIMHKGASLEMEDEYM